MRQVLELIADFLNDGEHTKKFESTVCAKRIGFSANYSEDADFG